MRDDVKHVAQRVVDGRTALDSPAVRERCADEGTAPQIENGSQAIGLGQEAYDGTGELAVLQYFVGLVLHTRVSNGPISGEKRTLGMTRSMFLLSS